MTALAQGSAGLALVMCFALLRTGQISAAAILLAVQSAAVAVTALVQHQPLMAVPPVFLAAGVWGGGRWLMRHHDLTLDPWTAPMGGAKLGIGAGAVLAILCQSQGGLALPSAIILLSILLAATRPHPLMQVVALVAAQNGLALAASLVTEPASLPASLLLPLACLALPLPLAAGLLLPAMTPAPSHAGPSHAGLNHTGPDPAGLGLARAWMARLPRTAGWLGWTDLGLALAMAAATLTVPLDSLASVFAPLLGLDGVLRSCVRRNRRVLTPIRRGTALAQTGFTVLAVCAPNLTLAWLAVMGGMAMALLPVLSRRWDGAALAFLGAGLALFGLLLLPATPTVLGYFSLFAGFATIAAVVPDLAVVLVILILRLANQATWPQGVEALGSGLAVIALLACALLMTSPARPHRITLLVLSHASIAALTICAGQAEGRFAALVLLILLILSRAATRVAGAPVAVLAVAALGGVPPLGVFPGLVLVALTLAAHSPWLLLPLGIASIPVVLSSFPRRLPDLSLRTSVPSIAWLPLLLAFVTGYFAPERLVHWWRILTVGRT
jgi:hypothetical protein